MIDGIQRATDPEQIARIIDEEKVKLVVAATRIREEHPDHFDNPH